MAGIPPWLDIHPSELVNAARAGTEAAQGQERIGLEQQRLAQSAGQAAAQLGMERQRLAMADKQTQMENQLRKQTLQQEFQRSQAQLEVAKAYHEATLGLAKDRLDTETQRLQQTIKQQANKADPFKLQQAKTLQDAYLEAIKNYQKNPTGPNARIASGFGQQAKQFDQSADTGQQPDAAAPSPNGTPGIPKPGDVLAGHTYKGGDPADQNSWEPVNAGQ